jgi:hypothetical protein
MNAPTPKTGSTSRPSWISLIQDDLTGKLSHSKVINLLGAATASTLMFILTYADKMNEGYFGLYVGAVLAQAIGYRVVSKNASSNSSPSNGAAQE